MITSSVYSYAKVLSPALLGKTCIKHFLNEYSALTEMEGSAEVLSDILEHNVDVKLYFL